MERILTEAELKHADIDVLMRWDSDGIGADKQDGILKTFSGSVKLSDDLIKSVGERIEQWMDEKTEDSKLGFNVTDSAGKYPSFSVNFKDSNSVIINGRIVYDIFTVHEHFNLKTIDRDFVYRQLKSYCEANLIKVPYTEFQYSQKQVLDKIGYDLNRVGILVTEMSFE
jgi:hypothetical protein